MLILIWAGISAVGTVLLWLATLLVDPFLVLLFTVLFCTCVLVHVVRHQKK